MTLATKWFRLLEDRITAARGPIARAWVLCGAFADVAQQAVAARRTAPRRRTSLRSRAEALAADVGFGWRQLVKNRATSLAAVLSLALAIGACTSAFMLIDALLLRPLPISEPGRLHLVSYESDLRGDVDRWDSGSYTLFGRMRAAVEGDAEVIAISPSWRRELKYSGSQETETPYLLRASGEMFAAFGLQPTLGRLLTVNDDITAREHPFAVISEAYWAQRFGRDTDVLGRKFSMDGDTFEIVGVVEAPFVGVEPGIQTDVFISTMMGREVHNILQNGLRTFIRLGPGVAAGGVWDRLDVAWRRFEEEKRDFLHSSRAGLREERLEASRLRLTPVAAGVSELQRAFGRPLMILGVLVSLVLLISCANVANLVTAQASTRGRDLAVRVAIGARRARLVQLALAENTLLALFATALGAGFAAGAAPVVVDMLSPRGAPIRLALSPDARVLGFSLVMALTVTLFFGVAPALRASGVDPSRALKAAVGRVTRHRSMRTLVAAQVAFCFVVLFVAGLFVATFAGLDGIPMGFSSDGVLAVSLRTQPAQQPAAWDELGERLRGVPGVEAVAFSGWPLLSGSSTNTEIAAEGEVVRSETLTELLCVSTEWISVMQIRLLDGTDIREDDVWPGVAIVNEAFAREYAGGESPVGERYDRVAVDGNRNTFRVAGLVSDVRYLGLRGPTAPAAYIPCRSRTAAGDLSARSFGAFMVRTEAREPLALAPFLEQAVGEAQGFRVRDVRTQAEIVDRHTVRERLLATLGIFFALVAVVLAGIGLAGVLHYSVLQRRREIGIRVALGASRSSIAQRTVHGVLGMVLVGLPIGVALGLAVVSWIESLLYGVSGTDTASIVMPCATILGLALLASLPGVAQGLRVDPARTLREE